MPYRLHLKTAVEIKQVGMLVKLPDPHFKIQQKSTCRNHRAHKELDSNNNLDASGSGLVPVAVMAVLSHTQWQTFKRVNGTLNLLIICYKVLSVMVY